MLFTYNKTIASADLVCYFFWIFCFNREVTISFGFSDQSYNSTNAWCNFVPCFSEDFAPIFFCPKESNSPILLDGNTKPVFFFSDDDSNRLIKNLIDVYDHSDIVSTRFYNSISNLEVHERLLSVHYNRRIYPLLLEMPYSVLHHQVRCIPEKKIFFTWLKI